MVVYCRNGTEVFGVMGIDFSVNYFYAKLKETDQRCSQHDLRYKLLFHLSKVLIVFVYYVIVNSFMFQHFKNNDYSLLRPHSMCIDHTMVGQIQAPHCLVSYLLSHCDLNAHTLQSQ